MARPKKPQSEKSVRQSVSMDPRQLERVSDYCRQQDRPLSWVIRKALDKFLEDNVA